MYRGRQRRDRCRSSTRDASESIGRGLPRRRARVPVRAVARASYDVQHPVTTSDRMTDAQREPVGAQPDRHRRRQRLPRAARERAALDRQRLRRRLRRAVSGSNGSSSRRTSTAAQPESDTSAHRRFTNGDGSRGVSWCVGDLHVSGDRLADLRRPRGERAASERAHTADRSRIDDHADNDRRPRRRRTSRPRDRACRRASCRPTRVGSSRRTATVDRDDRRRRDVARGRRRSAAAPYANAQLRFADAITRLRVRRLDDVATYPGRPTTAAPRGSRSTTPFPSVVTTSRSRAAPSTRSRSHQTRLRLPDLVDAGRPPVHWTEDPLVIPVGAGPVPSIQLVFSRRQRAGSIEIDRVVVGRRAPCSDRRHVVAVDAAVLGT